MPKIAFFHKLQPHLSDNQIIVFAPGSFASLVAENMMDQAKKSVNVTFVETTSIPFPCRQVKDGEAVILQPKRCLDISVSNPNDVGRVTDLLNEILKIKINPYDHILYAGLNNPNGVVHPATAVLNLGWIEWSHGDFYFYNQGMSSSVCRVLEAIDSDRIEIGKAFGLDLKPLLQIASEFYGQTFENMRDFAENSKLHNSVKACPQDINDRYFTEDIPYVLVPWYSLGQIVGIHSKSMQSIIDLGSIIRDTDYYKKGRNLDKMGRERVQHALLPVGSSQV